jgi:hypothetical protein
VLSCDAIGAAALTEAILELAHGRDEIAQA